MNLDETKIKRKPAEIAAFEAEENCEEYKGFEGREREARNIFCHNGFCYELIPEYGKFPAGFDYTMYSGGYCDADDNLYLFSRDTDRPIVVLDAEGRYVRDFGKRAF